jgi:tetratricopeptide (TPR) repeat protein
MNRAMLFLLSALLASDAIASALEPAVVAQEQFERGDYTSAIETASMALGENPHDARLFHWRSRSYMELKDYPNAVADAERAAAEQADSSEYRRWLGQAYGAAAEQGRSLSLARKVKVAFEQAVKLDPSNVDARRDLAEFYLQAPWIVGGNRGKALKEVTAIARLDPVAGYLAHASYSRHERLLEDADADYQRALDLRPARIDPYLDACEFYEERAEAAKLSHAAEGGGRVAPGDVRLLYYQGVALVLANRDLIEANHFLRTYLASSPRRSDFPSHAAADHWLGRLNECLGDIDAAEEAYRAALALEPDRKPSRDALSRLATSGLTKQWRTTCPRCRT